MMIIAQFYSQRNSMVARVLMTGRVTLVAYQRFNGLNDGKETLWLKACVTGKAYVAYNCLSHEIQDSFNLMWMLL